MRFVVVIPVYNEEKIIANTLNTLSDFLSNQYSYDQYQIIVSDNDSTDLTGQIVKGLQNNMGNLHYLRIAQRGKGIAIKSAWEQALTADFDVLAFMDADLATDLSALPVLIDGATSHDLCIGDRFDSNSNVERSLKRLIVSHGYRALSSLMLNSKISDLACGFKAISREAAIKILPKVQNQTWFFDHELTHLCEYHGMSVKQIPVHWRDPRNADQASKVNIPKVSWQFIKELNRLRLQK